MAEGISWTIPMQVIKAWSCVRINRSRLLAPAQPLLLVSHVMSPIQVLYSGDKVWAGRCYECRQKCNNNVYLATASPSEWHIKRIELLDISLHYQQGQILGKVGTDLSQSEVDQAIERILLG